MKKIIVYIFVACLFLNSNAKAQTDTSMQKSAVAVCNCLSKSKIDNSSTPEQLQQIFLGCIFSSAPDLVSKIISNGQDNQQAAEQIATQPCFGNGKERLPRISKNCNGDDG